MSAFKKLFKPDVTTVPYVANKHWNLPYTCFNGGDSYFNVYKGTYITGTFVSNDVSIDPKTYGQYERLVYDSINHMFYQSFSGSLLNTGSIMFNVDTYVSASQQRPTGSYFNYNTNPNLVQNFPTGANASILVLEVNRSVYGSKLLPNSFNLSSSAFNIKDDGQGNIYDYAGIPTFVGNIYYAHGIVVLTNSDYQPLFPLPPLAYNNTASFLTTDSPKTINILSNDVARSCTLNTGSVVLSGSNAQYYTVNSNGTITLNTTSSGNYNVQYTVTSTCGSGCVLTSNYGNVFVVVNAPTTSTTTTTTTVANCALAGSAVVYTTTTSTTTSTTTIIAPDCSIFLARETTNKLSLYDSVTHTNIELASLHAGCVSGQIAMDGSKMYIVDHCGNYNVYNYTTSPFSLTYDSQFTIWDNTYPSNNAGYGIAFKDSNTLFVVNSVGVSPSLVSDIYEYNLTTHIATPYMSISDNSFITSILYNTSNSQTVIAYTKPDTLYGNIQLYSGTTLLAQITLSSSYQIPNALYYDGTNIYGITQAGLIFTYDFVALTATQVTPSVSYPDMQFPNVGGAGQHYTCYNFNIPYSVNTTTTSTTTTTTTAYTGSSTTTTTLAPTTTTTTTAAPTTTTSTTTTTTTLAPAMYTLTAENATGLGACAATVNVTYYMTHGATLQVGNALYQNSNLSTPAINGYYSDGTNYYLVSGGSGVIASGGTCASLTTTTTTTAAPTYPYTVGYGSTPSQACYSPSTTSTIQGNANLFINCTQFTGGDLMAHSGLIYISNGGYTWEVNVVTGVATVQSGTYAACPATTTTTTSTTTTTTTMAWTDLSVKFGNTPGNACYSGTPTNIFYQGSLVNGVTKFYTDTTNFIAVNNGDYYYSGNGVVYVVTDSEGTLASQTTCPATTTTSTTTLPPVTFSNAANTLSNITSCSVTGTTNIYLSSADHSTFVTNGNNFSAGMIARNSDGSVIVGPRYVLATTSNADTWTIASNGAMSLRATQC
jgi:hypothetical protein